MGEARSGTRVESLEAKYRVAQQELQTFGEGKERLKKPNWPNYMYDISRVRGLSVHTKD